ncbi:alkaline phosphatase family protein [Paenibacillus sp. TRM 82003]|uniref:alkaline phosphatase family protein n=1 Tax=Kineococcus sp. TRM81007 TaxID=2925831 RepID=UPI001F5A3254|nr:nucleotide pyrophosphatase/phosphodiesterase family protein [Kineococcus sp. TRM81007]MCI2240391.1 alkaline phosphatase family protein [Kineococcus sp. TRM81007]MCI3927433.1 alkaline phosphatase family protein [Paenibacillus sp. TRM 82003]
MTSPDGGVLPVLPAPSYGRDTLADLMPALERALGAAGGAGADAGALELPAADRVCLLLVDGMGEVALRERSGHTPALRRWRADGRHRVLTAGFPTTTATSMGLLGTGLPPGSHGLVGYEVLDPDRDALLNQLQWDGPADPRRWQPHTTVFQRLTAAGVPVTRVAPPHFDGSGLTEAALRGGRFVGTPERLEARVDAAVAAVRAAPRGLTYVYWGLLDRTGHGEGVGSWQWGEELGRVDAAVGELARRLPRGTLLVVTADHGMVDVPAVQRLDVAHEPALRAGVRHVGGEPRAVQLYTEPGAAEEVARAWSGRLGERARVLTRAQAVDAGWFGAVEEHVSGRIGDVLAVMTAPVAVVDSARMRPEALRLLGQHGALTDDERLVPLFTAVL